MLRLPRAACALASLLLLAGGATAAPPSGDDDASFKERFAGLEKTAQVIQIQMGAKEDPARLPEQDSGGGQPVLVSGSRMGLYQPPILEPSDMLAIVQQNMKDIRRCYKAQLDADPEWADEMILDLSVRKTGRVSEVEVSPRRVKRAAIGECLMSTVPKWRFPEFTGEIDDGLTQEVVNASFPLSFSTRDR